MKSTQLPLTLNLKDSATLEAYWPASNKAALVHLQRWLERPGEHSIYLCGEAGTGKSHLLQAVCHALGYRDRAAVYLPMQAIAEFSVELLDGMENMAMVCIDDIQVIAGRPEWERALVRLIESVQQAGGGLLLSGATVPMELGLDLPQLVSRLCGGLLFRLESLDEVEKQQALELRAERRGLYLSAAAGRYLVRHYGQETQTLFAALETLDQASLVAKRKLTIPFVKSVLGEDHST